MKKFHVEIETADPRAGQITSGMLGEIIADELDRINISYGRLAVEPIYSRNRLHPSVRPGGTLSPQAITKKLAEGYCIIQEPPRGDRSGPGAVGEVAPH